MIELSELDVLYDVSAGVEIPLPQTLARIYGRLKIQCSDSRPYVISNYVQSLDGVVTLDSGKSAGGPISGHNKHDRVVMSILRSIADAVIVGAGTLRSVPRHIWTAQYIHPEFAAEFRDLRSALGMTQQPFNVVVTGKGNLDSSFAILNQEEVPVLIVTTARGAKTVPRTEGAIEVAVASESEEISPQDILDAVAKEVGKRSLFLVEAGPMLLGQFLAERLVDELFLTVAPQIAGRDASEKRPGLVAGRVFAPEDPLWGRLIGVRRAGSHIFLRYALPDIPVVGGSRHRART
jgi:riboflavin biosynthesis pyrimidine reductase